MIEKKWLFASIADTRTALHRREFSCEELVCAYLDHILNINPRLNSVLEIAPDSVLEQARLADSALRQGQAIGPLHGLPFTVKDVFAVSPDIARLIPAPGMATRPDPDSPTISSPVVRRLREAGAILLGVTRASLWSDREQHYGPVHNPYDFTRTTSGSSGGEAATVAAGGSLFGMGSDSGGSLRHPAHYCGIVTIRPSNGRVPRATDAAGTNDPRTVAGPLTRFVDDAALVLSVISGYTPEDPTTLPLPPPGDHRAMSLSGLRIAYFSDNGIASPTPEVDAMVRACARALQERGATVAEIPLPDIQESWEITSEYWRWCGEVGNVAEYFRFLERWDRYRVTALSFLENWDIILCPTEAYPAPRINDSNGPASMTYTTPFSLIGLPGVVVRAGTSPEGMPLTVQITAGPLQDACALGVAKSIEETFGGYEPPPE